ncbi:hypothetical protein YPPY25_4565, partial [Yersinia pestis PY-25]
MIPILALGRNVISSKNS